MMKMKPVWFLLTAAINGRVYYERLPVKIPIRISTFSSALDSSNMEGFPGESNNKTRQSMTGFKSWLPSTFQNWAEKRVIGILLWPLCAECSTGLCPADYFGRTMVANLPKNIRVGVVNVSVAGCKIELFDKDNYKAYAATVAPWMSNIIKEYGGSPYAHLVEMGKLAQKDGVIKGILLHQGESNNNDKQWPAKVKGIYDNLIKDLSLKPESAPLLAGELVNADLTTRAGLSLSRDP